MTSELIALCITACYIGFLHTLIGPDHYVPFIALAKDRGWAFRKTVFLTTLCGLGHVLGSIVLGMLGVAAGWALGFIEDTESMRGDWAARLLIAFGLVYMVWGLRKAWRAKLSKDDAHGHDHSKATKSVWILFIIFAFGPCEPLIPVLMYPAATQGVWEIVLVTSCFAVATIGTMLTMVTIGTYSLKPIRTTVLSRYSHALAGGAITACGLLMVLGL